MRGKDISTAKKQRKRHRVQRSVDIAIIGMACRFPDAKDYKEFWNNLVNGVNSIKEIPKSRWDIDKYYSPNIDEPNKSISKWCGLLEDIDKFDNGFFNISPREANNMDPQQRLLLEETWHCIEDSGVSLSMLQESKTSVYVGVMTADYRQEAVKPYIETDSYACLGSYECILANRISYMFNLSGYSISINAACASSLVALHEAKRALAFGESDYAIAGGVSLDLHPWKYISFSKSRMLSPDGQCKTFDKDANGYVPGEGTGVVLLQRLDEAIKDGNHIYGIIKGSSVNHGGRTLSITAPRVEAQQNVIVSAYEDARINPESVSYVEAHGTGTSLGDPIEVEALTRAFRKYTSRNQFCRIGSVKTNIGHLEAAAGIAGVIKVLLMMRYGKIPKTLNVNTLNPVIRFERSPFIVATSLTDWNKVKEDEPLRAGVSSFGFGGVNSHVLLEEYIGETVDSQSVSDSDNLFILSAKTSSSLSNLINEWKSLINNRELSEYSLHDICATLATGRESFDYRVGKCVRDIREIKKFLDTLSTDSFHKKNQRVWCLRIGEICVDNYSGIEDLMKYEVFSEKAEYVLRHLDSIDIQARERFKRKKWPKKYIPLFSFIIGFVFISTLIELGYAPEMLTAEKKGMWIGLVISRIIKLEDMLAVLCGKKQIDQIQFLRPFIPYYDSITNSTFMPIQFDEEYIQILIDKVSIQKGLLNEFIIDGDVQLEHVLNKAVENSQKETRLGIILVKSEIISKEQLEDALAVQNATGGLLGEILIEKGYCTLRDLNKSLREQEVLREYVDEARILSVSQHTFKSYIEEWNKVLEPAGYSNILDMLQDEELLLSESETLRKKQLLLLVIIVSSLRRLNNKWNLTEQRQIDDDKFLELLDLVIDDVMPKQIIVELLTAQSPNFHDASKVLNARQGKINTNNPYKLLKSRNRILNELKDVPEWINKALSLPSQIPSDKNTVFFDYGVLTQYDHSSSLISVKFDKYSDCVLIGTLLELWLQGVDIKWERIYPEGTFNKPALPKYVFDKESFWLQSNACDSTDTSQAQQPAFNPKDHSVLGNKSKPNTGYRILEKDWKESAVNSLDTHEFSGTIVILVNDRTGMIAGELLEHRNKINAITVRNSSSYVKESNKDYSIDFTNEEHGIKTVEDILANNNKVIGFIDLSDIHDYSIEECTVSMAKITILQSLIRSIEQETFTILHLTKGLQPYKTKQPTLAGADFAGFIKMLSAEYRKVQSRTVDIDNVVEIKNIILNEIAIQDTEGEVCYRESKRFVPYMKELIYDNQKNSGPIAVNPDKVIVITGGTRGIGAEVASHLVCAGAKKLVLMGIQELPPREQWEMLLNNSDSDTGTVHKIRMIMGLEERGANINVYTGSLIQKDRLKEFFSEVRLKMGNIGGVIHCAGLALFENPAFINKSVKDILKVFEPKVQGLQVLHDVFANDKLDFFILFSSVSAAIPVLGTGMSDYAAANAFMDYFAAYQFSKGKAFFKSINWPSWKEAGMGEMSSPVYRSLGLETLSTADGLYLMDNSIRQKHKACLMPCLVEAPKFNTASLLWGRQEQKASAQPETNSVKTTLTTTTKAAFDTMKWLKELFSKELRISKDKLIENKTFGEFGVDSILLAELVKRVEEKIKVKLDPSIFLEYPTLDKLNSYLNENFGHAFKIEETYSADELEKVEPQSVVQDFAVVHGEGRLESENTLGQVNSSIQQKVAVIGLACHFPGARNKETFWNNLKEGKSSITEVPKSRWDIERYYSSEYQKGKSISKWGGFIEDIEYFDPGYFGITEEEAPHIDPLVRQFLEVSFEALGDAGYTKDDLWGRRVGIFVGSRISNYAERIKQPLKTTIIGIGQNFISAHISHLLNLKGPSIVVDTACSSSLVSLHLACQSLILRESDMAIAGGVDILLDEKLYLILSEGRALSPDGKSHTFDEKANGFVPGEGCGAVLLKSLDKAVADGDKIYAVIEASAVNNDGNTMGITTPNPEAQSEVIKEALRKGNVNPATITYVEAHGTGTMIGDPIELKALTKVYKESTDEKQFCAVGSVKTNIGHLLSAAGIAGFIKIVLSIWNRQIPPTINCEKPNPRFEFEKSPFYPNVQLKNWEPRGNVRRAGISSFGFGGTNAHIIVSECDPMLLSNYQSIRKSSPAISFNRKRYWLDRNDSAGQVYQYSEKDIPGLNSKDKDFSKRIEIGEIPSMLEFIDESPGNGKSK